LSSVYQYINIVITTLTLRQIGDMEPKQALLEKEQLL